MTLIIALMLAHLVGAPWWAYVGITVIWIVRAFVLLLNAR